MLAMNSPDLLGLSDEQKHFVIAFEWFLESYIDSSTKTVQAMADRLVQLSGDPNKPISAADKQAAEEFELTHQIGKEINHLRARGSGAVINVTASMPDDQPEFPFDVVVQIPTTTAAGAAPLADPCCGWCRVNGHLVCCLSC
jgi:hypothetical protein